MTDDNELDTTAHDEKSAPVDHSGPYPLRTKTLAYIEPPRRGNYIRSEDGEHFRLHHLTAGDPRNEATIAAYPGQKLGLWAEGETITSRAEAEAQAERRTLAVLAMATKLQADEDALREREIARRKADNDTPRWH